MTAELEKRKRKALTAVAKFKRKNKK